MSRNQFRILVVLNQLLVLATVVVQEISDNSLPPELRSFLGSDESVMNPETSAASFSYVNYWFGTVILVLGLIASVGLFFGQRWGRTLFVLAWLGTLSFSLTSDLYISTGWSASVGYLASTTDGAILGLVYFSHVKRIFAKPKDDY